MFEIQTRRDLAWEWEIIYNPSRFHLLQVVEEYEGPAPDAQNEDFCIVIANEDDLEVCVPYLEQGSTSTLGKKLQISVSSFAVVGTRTFESFKSL